MMRIYNTYGVTVSVITSYLGVVKALVGYALYLYKKKKKSLSHNKILTPHIVHVNANSEIGHIKHP